MRRSRRLRQRIPFLATVLALGLLIAAYIFGLAWLQSRNAQFYSAEDLHVPRLIDVMVFLWLFWIGSSVGSFLNVVAWRMPRGKGVSGRSYCPRCETKLRATDNIPVFGWLALGGRCRTCKLPISGRYPIVEACVGMSLTIIGIFELYRLALPHQFVHWHGGPLWAPRVDQTLIAILLYHTVALAVSWAFGLIRWDGHRLPWKLLLFAVIAVGGTMIAWPTSMIASWKLPRPDAWFPDGQYLDSVMRVLTAVVAAAIMGRSLTKGMCPQADPKLNPLGSDTNKLIDLIAIIAVPAVVVGWQASPAVVLLASVIALVIRPFIPTRLDAMARFAISVPVAFTIQIILWRKFDLAGMWPSESSQPGVLLAWGAMVLCIPIWLNDRGREAAVVELDESADDEDSSPEPEPQVIPDDEDETFADNPHKPL